MRVLALGLILTVVVVACSDQVPPPTTPTPSPRPGYPPAPVSELPEGVLFVQQPSSGPPMVFGIGPDGEARAYERGSTFAVSPDDTRVAVVATEKSIATGGWLPTSLLLLSGAGYETVVDDRWEAGAWPMIVWSPEGESLAYTQPDEMAKDRSHVWVVDADTGATRQLTMEADFYSLLGWAATGEVLVTTPDGLALLGSERRNIRLPEAGDFLDIEMSPDGRSIAVKPSESEHNNESELTYLHSNGIWVGDLGAGGWHKVLDLTGQPPEVLLTGGQEMRWSPDGRRITVHRARMDESGTIADSLSVLDVETGKETLVHEQGWGFESWSPDGRYLAYWYEGNAEAGQPGRQLGILGPDGRKREAEAHPRGVAWAMNGQLLLDVPGHLSLLDPETMDLKEVTTEDGESISVLLEAPVWSPSGRYFALSTPADMYHRSSLYVIDAKKGTAELFFDEAGFPPVAWLRQ